MKWKTAEALQPGDVINYWNGHDEVGIVLWVTRDSGDLSMTEAAVYFNVGLLSLLGRIDEFVWTFNKKVAMEVAMIRRASAPRVPRQKR